MLSSKFLQPDGGMGFIWTGLMAQSEAILTSEPLPKLPPPAIIPGPHPI